VQPLDALSIAHTSGETIKDVALSTEFDINHIEEILNVGGAVLRARRL
jgi:hypothetical protein